VGAISVSLLVLITHEHSYIGVFLVTIAIGSSGFVYGAGFLVTFNDVGGRFSGMALAISNTLASVPGCIAPQITGILTKNVT
jgi:ACS family sodium-dependent inorganic phosphate cotransporter-like MFS transporter 5